MNEHGMNENEIRELLGEGIGEEPPIVGGPAAVFAGARRQTVRTRAIAGALSAVAVLGIAGGAVAFGDAAGKSGASRPGATASSAGQVPIDGRSVAEILKLELPAGLSTGDYNGAQSGTQDAVAVMAGMSMDDGTGKLTQVFASVGRHPYEAISAQACENLYHRETGISDCQAQMQPDGSVVLVYRGEDNHRDAQDRPLNTYSLFAEHLFPNGTDVLVSAANWYSPPTAPAPMAAPSRPAPLLSVNQLKSMVMDPRWGLAVAPSFARQAERDITPYFDATVKH